MFGVLNVYLTGRFIGQFSWESERNVYSFRYDAAYLADATAERLSFSLPLQSEPFDSETSYNYFANLLPPVVVRKKLEKCLHISKDNVYGFLKAIGGDCAGAVSLYAPGTKPEFGEVEHLRPLSDEDATSILKSLRRRPMYAAGELGYRYSGAGAQDKLVARLDGDTLVLPLYGTPSTHIVKPAASDFEESVANEFFCQRLAQRVGLPAAEASIKMFGGERYYVSQRFDRAMVDGHLTRLHQEDFCQMLSVDPEIKYEEDGGPTVAACVETLRRLHVPVNGLLLFFDLLIFNVLIGNADAHGKNYSVFYHKGRPNVAPLYDAVSTLVYPELSPAAAMSIGGETALAKLTREHFVRLATDCRISPKLVLARLDGLCDKILQEVGLLKDEISAAFPSPVYAKIEAIVQSQCSHLS